jgi:hypothetical protein
MNLAWVCFSPGRCRAGQASSIRPADHEFLHHPPSKRAKMTNPRAASVTANAYRSYLVRFWQSHEQGCWRASAQCVQTGNTVLFGDVASLLAFLQTEVQGRPPESEPGEHVP